MIEQFDHLYLTVFLVTAGSLLLLERVRSLQRVPVPLAGRWSANLGLLVAGNMLVSLVLPISAVALAQRQEPRMLGQLAWPPGALIVLTFMLIDLWRYWEHRLFHHFTVLWRLHLVHHSDAAVDVTTAERHHPLESLAGTAIMMALVVALGLPAAGIALYVLVASVISFVTHANLRLPPALDRVLSLVVVTPAVHAVHHSALRSETNSNFGAVLTLWDRCFGTWSDPSRTDIAHFGLEYFHRARDAGLWQALCQPALYRRGLVQAREAAVGQAHASEPVRPKLKLSAAWRSALRWGAPGLALALAALWPTFAQLMRMTAASETYQYTWLVIPMLAYLLGWRYREDLMALQPQPSFSGAALAALAAVLWAGAALVNIDVARQFAMALALQGIALAMLGWRAYRRLFAVFALLFFLVPAGDVLQPSLRLLTVRMMEIFAAVAGLPHRIDGFLVFIGDKRYVVIDECAGLTYVLLSAFLAYSLGLLLYRSFFKVAALGLFGALLGIVCNGLRVNAIVLIDWLRGSQMDLSAHGSLQWMALLITLGILFIVLHRLQGDTVGERALALVGRPTAAWRAAWLAPLMAGAMLLAATGGMAALPASAPVPSRVAQGELPPSIAGWQLASEAPTWVVDPGTHSQSLALTYHRDADSRAGREMQVTVVETLSPAVKLPEAVLVPHDREVWRVGRVGKQTACAGARCFAMLHTSWQRARSKDRRELFYLYAIGDQTTDSRLMSRMIQGWQRLSGAGRVRLIVVAFDGAAAPLAEIAEVFSQVQVAMTQRDFGPSAH
ncbi:MAG: exosortase [Pseudomonadota bacterium]